MRGKNYLDSERTREIGTLQSGLNGSYDSVDNFVFIEKTDFRLCGMHVYVDFGRVNLQTSVVQLARSISPVRKHIPEIYPRRSTFWKV